MKYFQRSAVLILCVVLAMSMFLIGCGKDGGEEEKTQTDIGEQQGNENEETTSEDAKEPDPRHGGLVMPLTEKDITYTWMLEQHPTYPVNEDWSVLKKLQETTGVSLKIEAVPMSSWKDKKNLLISSGDIPDIMKVELTDAQKYASEGVFKCISGYMDYAPNLERYIQENPVVETSAAATDGKLYGFPSEENNEPLVGYMYRKDIFEKHDIAVPQTEQDVYNALIKLKEEYPDSLGFASRQFTNGRVIQPLGYQYGVDANPDNLIKYNFGMDKVVFSPSLSNFKVAVESMHVLYSEELIDQNYALATTSQWETQMLTGKCFFTYDWVTRARKFDQSNQESDNPIEGYDMEIMFPFKTTTGGPGWAYISSPPIRDTINVLSSEIKDPEVAVGLFDYLYSPEGMELFMWGLGGETFKYLEDGAREYLPNVSTHYNTSEEAEPKENYGLYYNGIMHRYDRKPGDRLPGTPKLMNYIQRLFEENRVEPQLPVYKIKDEEMELYKELYPAINKYYVENIDKFVMGKRPMTEWDDFIAEFDKFEVNKLVEMMQGLHDRHAG